MKSLFRKVLSVLVSIMVIAQVLPVSIHADDGNAVYAHHHTKECYQLICEETDLEHVHVEECYDLESIPECGILTAPVTVEFFKYDPDTKKVGDKISEDTVLDGKGDNVYVTFTFDTLFLKGTSGKEFNLGDYSPIFGQPTSREVLIQCRPNANSSIYGIVYHNTDGTISFEILSDAEKYSAAPYFNNVHVNFVRRLNVNDHKEEYHGAIDFEIPLVPEAKFQFIDENGLPTKPEIKKSGSEMSAQGVIDWTISYKAPSTYFAGTSPTNITDTLPEHMSLVEGTLKIDDVPAEPVFNNNGQLLIDVSGYRDGKDHEIKYSTEASDQAKLSIIGALAGSAYDLDISSFTNKAQMMSDAAPVDDEVSATVNIDKDSPMKKGVFSKNGVYNYTGENRKVDWVVEVKTNGINYGWLTLTDNLKKGLDVIGMQVMVTDASGNDIEVPSYSMSLIKNTDESHTLTVRINGQNPNNELTNSLTDLKNTVNVRTYTFKYSTIIKDGYFTVPMKYNDNDVKNDASLSWGWRPGGDGDWVILTPPELSIYPGNLQNTIDHTLKKAAISKEYDPSTHVLKWKATINENRIPLESFKLVEKVNVKVTKGNGGSETASSNTQQAMQKLYSVNNIVIANADDLDDALEELFGPGSVTNAKLTSNDNGVAVGFEADVTPNAAHRDNIINIPLATQAIDPSFCQNNASSVEFFNTIAMEDIKAVGNEEELDHLCSSATQEQSNKVLSKASVSYDPSDATLTWSLTVNSDKVDSLNNVVIDDEVPSGLIFDPDTVKFELVDGNNKTPLTQDTKTEIGHISGDDDTVKTIVTFTIDSLSNKKCLITYKTRANINDPAFRDNSTVTFENVAKMKSDEYKGPVSVKATATITNDAIQKNASGLPEGTIQDFVIRVNPNKVSLSIPDGRIQNIEVVDKLDEGAVVDFYSIRLFVGKVETKKEGNTFKVSVNRPADGSTEILDFKKSQNVADNSFTVVLPDGQTPYVIEYKVYAMVAGVKLNNDAKLTGTVLPEHGNNGLAGDDFEITASSDGEIPVPPSNYGIRIGKVDTAGKLIRMSEGNAEFGLFIENTDEEGNVTYEQFLNTAHVNSVGYASFSFPAASLPEGVEKLYVKEIKAPTGYQKGLDEFAFVISVSELEKNVTKQYKVTNSSEKVDVTVTKIWDDLDDLYQERGECKFTLKATYAGKTVDLDTVTFKANEEGEWPDNYVWNDLPKYNYGELITYSVEETLIPDGYSSKSDLSKSGDDLTYAFTNTKEFTSVSFKKVWDDENDRRHKRSDYEVTLFEEYESEGKAVRKAVDVVKMLATDEGYEWKDLPVDHFGNVIEYTVEETLVPHKYRPTIKYVLDEETGEYVYEITNKYHEDPPVVHPVVNTSVK